MHYSPIYHLSYFPQIKTQNSFERRKSKRRKKKKKKNHLDIHEVSEGRRCILRAANNANKSKDNKAPWQPGDRRVPLSRIIETTIAANHVSRSRERWSRVLDTRSLRAGSSGVPYPLVDSSTIRVLLSLNCQKQWNYCARYPGIKGRQRRERTVWSSVCVCVCVWRVWRWKLGSCPFSIPRFRTLLTHRKGCINDIVRCTLRNTVIAFWSLWDRLTG